MTILRQVARPLTSLKPGFANSSFPTTNAAATGRGERASTGGMRLRSASSLARMSSWLAAQPRDFAEALLSTARLREFTAGAVVIGINDVNTGLHFLVQGCVQLTVPRPHQELSLAHIILPGEWFGEVSALSDLGSPGEYRARGRCVTLSVPRTDLALLQQHCTTTASAMITLLAAASRRLTEVMADAAGLDPVGRVISKLLTLSATASGTEGSDARLLPVTQFELAELCSVSRATIRKVIRELEGRQAVDCRYREIRILSQRILVDALRDLALREA